MSNYKGHSVVDYLKSVGKQSSYSERAKLAKEYNIQNYAGTGEQNTQLLSKLRTGETPILKGIGLQPTQTKKSDTTDKKQYQEGDTRMGSSGKKEMLNPEGEWIELTPYMQPKGKEKFIQEGDTRKNPTTGKTETLNPEGKWISTEHPIIKGIGIQPFHKPAPDPISKSEKTPITPTTPKDNTVNIVEETKQINEDINIEQEKELEIIGEEAGDKVDISASTILINKLIEKLDEKPKTKSSAEIYAEQRLSLGLEPLESDLAGIDTEIAQLEADYANEIGDEGGRRVSMSQIRRRQTEVSRGYESQLRDLRVERSSLVSELNTKYGVLNTMVTLTGQDYNNAQQNYQAQFSNTIQLTNLLQGIEQTEKSNEERKIDNARANAQIMYNLVKTGNVNYDKLDDDTKLQIKEIEMQGQLPTGFIKYVSENIKDPAVSFLPQFTDEEGNRIQPVATISSNGKYSINNVKIGTAKADEDKTKDIISQSTLNKLGAVGVPEDVALDIQRSVNKGHSKETIVAHLNKQLGENKGDEMMKNYESFMSDTTFQF